MVKKMKQPALDHTQPLADAVCASAQRIWQAGLGAFATAQDEGEELFAKLVEQGARLQHQLRDAGAEQAAGRADQQPYGSWEKLEKVFEDRVARALHRLGVPTREDLDALARRMDELDQSMLRLAGKEPSASGGAVNQGTAGAAPAPAKAARKRKAAEKEA